jgi:hypothetical protein
MYQHFRIMPFLAGLAVGFALLFWYQAPAKIIYEYPHPQNVRERVYRDTNGVCYSYTAQKVGCDANEATLKPYPLQS